jgi:LPS sulfotransferase NodH
LLQYTSQDAANIVPVPSIVCRTGGPDADFAQIAVFHRDILEHEAAWRRYFGAAGSAPLTATYEDPVANQNATTCAALTLTDGDRAGE